MGERLSDFIEFYGDWGPEVHFRVSGERFSDFLSLLDRVWYQSKTNNESVTMINTFMFMEIEAYMSTLEFGGKGSVLFKFVRQSLVPN